MPTRASAGTSMADIAREAGVTKTTVSMIFRNKPGISEATRRRVLEAASELNYQYGNTNTSYRGQVGLMLVSGEKPRLGRTLGGDYLHRIIDGCMGEATEQGSSVLLNRMTFDQVEAGTWPPALQRGQVDGVIVRGWFPGSLQQYLDRIKLPYVLLDCNREVPGCTQVQIANASAMDQIVEHVAMQGIGQFATITGDMDYFDERDHINAQERHAGLLAALGRRRLALHDEAIVYERGFNEASGRRGVEKLLKRGVKFQALVCHNDLIAIGAVSALRDAGLRVPEDIRVTGFDNMEFAQMCSVPLTTIDPHLHQLGRLSIGRLLAWIHDTGDTFQHLHIKVPGELIVRASA